jgi:hypothetical protein
VFGRPATDWDTPPDIDLRLYPAAVAGYGLFQKEQNFIQFPVGLGYVYENFDGSGTNDYFSLYLNCCLPMSMTTIPHLMWVIISSRQQWPCRWSFE